MRASNPAPLVILLALVLLAPACGGSDGDPAPPAGGSGGASGAPPRATGLVVVHTDYKSASVSLVSAAGEVVKDGCIGSGTRAPQLTTALSGDVVVPSQPQPGGAVALIDRTNATLTWIDRSSCAVVRQTSVGSGFKANPHDLVGLSAAKAYVLRYGADPGNPDQGRDLAILDPASGAITGRIDLRPHTPQGSDPAKPIVPMPDRAVLAGGKVYVTLNNMSADFKAAVAGRVLVVDPEKDAVTGSIDLPLKNCGVIVALAQAKTLAVGCAGVFADGPRQIDGSGVALVDIGQSPPQMRTVAAGGFGRPISNFDLAILEPSTGFTVTFGEFMGPPPDQLWAFDLAGGPPRKFFDASASFALSGIAVDAGAKLLFVADANEKQPRLHLFDLSNPAAPTLQRSVASSASGLPPRYLGWY